MNILDLSYHIERKGLDHLCEGYVVAPILTSRVTEKEIKMTKQNKNRKGQPTLEEMVQSGSQLVLMRDDGTEQPVEALAEKNEVLKLGTTMRAIEMDRTGLDDAGSDPDEDDPYAKEFHYKSWWNQFRGPWLQSEKMTEAEIKTRADDAWECGDYKEMINLMAELICRLEKK